jgi:hypothetical protein
MAEVPAAAVAAAVVANGDGCELPQINVLNVKLISSTSAAA